MNELVIYTVVTVADDFSLQNIKVTLREICKVSPLHFSQNPRSVASDRECAF